MSSLVIVGAGPIGTAAAFAAIKDGVADSIAGVVDPDPEARAELESATGAPGFAATVDVPTAREGDRAVVAFSSHADKVAPEIVRLLAAGYHVVTTCEELAWPPRHIWEAMHTTARSNGRAVLVAGANPGFVMDQFPLLAAAASREVTSIAVSSHVDTSQRRASLASRTGHGITRDEFDSGIAAGWLGHKGLTQSARLLAHGLRWPNQDVAETIDPIEREGAIRGVHQTAVLRSEGRTIELELILEWGLEDPRDVIRVEGTPPLRITIAGGYHGDQGTTAQIVRALRRCADLMPA